ncbi:MAG TPA: 4'-phosphopantetheinyl transferase superfamily protein [Solirubrobacterales bacterium]|nr:4'-phosphopantetheinyl transferase superfamily protein [Solirubrobacterales bacterium]
MDQLPEPARQRRIVQQALRRSVLAEYAGVEVNELQLAFEPGEPISSPVEGLLVSASHFDDMTALAIVDKGLGLGVDLEPCFEEDWREALEMVLTNGELREMDALDARLQPRRYFELWTIKESVMKALGAALGDRDPRSIEIKMEGRSPKIASIDGLSPSAPWGLWCGSVNGFVCSAAVLGVRRVRAVLHEWRT